MDLSNKNHLYWHVQYKKQFDPAFYPVIYDTAVSPKHERNPGDEGFFMSLDCLKWK